MGQLILDEESDDVSKQILNYEWTQMSKFAKGNNTKKNFKGQYLKKIK